MTDQSTSRKARLVVVMGVSGSGKTTVAKALSAQFGWPFQEGDDLHPAANVEKMSHGIPLDDKDRAPWLAKCHDWLARHAAQGGVLTCSALKRSYRDILRQGLDVTFLYLHTDAALIAERMQLRKGHYMPPSLLPSQLATLEIPGPDENAIQVDTGAPSEDVIRIAIERLS